MTKSSGANDDLLFLSGGGEMGKLIRSYNWKNSPLGPPQQWPQSLRTSLGILLHSAFPMFLFWGKDMICFYNDAFRPSLGIDGRHPAVGMKGEELWYDTWEYVGPMLKQVMETGVPVFFEDELLAIHRNGKMEDVYWTFSYTPIHGDDNHIYGVLVNVIETTEKKKTIEALKASEKRFRVMADNIPNLAWMANADGWIYWYNKKWYEYTGTNEEEMKGWGWKSVHDPARLDDVISKWGESIASGKPFEMVFPIKGADGKYRQFLTRVLPLLDNDGKITQWFGSNTDITEQIEAEQRIKESEERFRTMAESADVMIAVGDDTGNAVYFNHAWQEFTGRPIQSLLAYGWTDMLHELDRDNFVETYQHHFAERSAFNSEIRILNRENMYRWIEIKAIPRISPDGTFAGFISTGIDITDRKETEQRLEQVVKDRTRELKDSNNDLQKSNAELAQFAYIASHDLQEPLRKITTFSQMLNNSMGNSLDEKSQNYLHKINTSITRMNTLIKDVLNYSELVEERSLFKQVSLTAILEGVIHDYDLLIEQKNAEINFSGLPEITAIPLQMSQLFGNLVGNALKFGRKDRRPRIEIVAGEALPETIRELRLNPSQKYTWVRFSDNGIGFKPEFADKIFHIFQRLHRKSEYEGTGIGLAMCKKIVLNHQGAINADGSSENGAIFNIYLPYRHESTPQRAFGG